MARKKAAGPPFLFFVLPTARRAGIPFPRYACRHPPRVAVRITLSVYRAARVALRTMKIAIILDPLDRIKTYKDTTYAMMVEAASRGTSCIC